MQQATPQFFQYLEDAILEHGRFACPNPECPDIITSKKIRENQQLKVEYGCRNARCTFHEKRTFLPKAKEVTVTKIRRQGIRNKGLLGWFGRLAFPIVALFHIITQFFDGK